MWWREVTGGRVFRARQRATSFARGLLGICAATQLGVGCFPALSEPGGDALAGAGGDAAHVAGAPSVAGRSGGMGWGSSKGGRAGSRAGAGGGLVVPAGARPSAGGPSSVGTEDVGGAPGSGGEPGSGGSLGGAGGEADEHSQAGTGDIVSSPTQAELEAETIERWNAIADDRPGDTYNFHWNRDMFPHPTFAAMGEALGYREFAVVLDVFLAANFDFLAEHRQFLTPYYYVTASPIDDDLVGTWDSLSSDFATMSYGNIPTDVQDSLAERHASMQAYE